MYFYVEKKGQWVTCNKLIYTLLWILRVIDSVISLCIYPEVYDVFTNVLMFGEFH